MIQRVSQITGVQAHGAGLTGVRDVVSTNNDSTDIIVQQNNVDEGVDYDEDNDGDNPEDMY